MNAVFADTFYWVAFTNFKDVAHERVKAFTLGAKVDLIWTTEEVLTEYLNYFAGWGRISETRRCLTFRECARIALFE
jgi:uncharacterized protein